jgi:hypothetical protein
MCEPKCFWKCEACGGWFDLGGVLDHERRFPFDVGVECSCPDPDIQQRVVGQEAKPLNAIDRVKRACQSIAEELSHVGVVGEKVVSIDDVGRNRSAIKK